jgi:hypothetical protein
LWFENIEVNVEVKCLNGGGLDTAQFYAMAIN